MLSRPMQQTFANKQVTCIEYDGLTNDQEREIFQVSKRVWCMNSLNLFVVFQRVQLGVALTVAGALNLVVNSALRIFLT